LPVLFNPTEAVAVERFKPEVEIQQPDVQRTTPSVRIQKNMELEKVSQQGLQVWFSEKLNKDIRDIREIRKDEDSREDISRQGRTRRGRDR